MKYYDEKDDRPRLYGGVAVAIYAIAVAALLLLIYIPITVVEVPEMMVIEFEEVEPPTPQPNSLLVEKIDLFPDYTQLRLIPFQLTFYSLILIFLFPP